MGWQTLAQTTSPMQIYDRRLACSFGHGILNGFNAKFWAIFGIYSLEKKQYNSPIPAIRMAPISRKTVWWQFGCYWIFRFPFFWFDLWLMKNYYFVAKPNPMPGEVVTQRQICWNNLDRTKWRKMNGFGKPKKSKNKLVSFIIEFALSNFFNSSGGLQH